MGWYLKLNSWDKNVTYLVSESIHFTLLQTVTTSLGITKCRLISSELVGIQRLLRCEIIDLLALDSRDRIDVSSYWGTNQMLI